MATPIILKTETDFSSFLETNPGHLSVLSFVAPWSENCIATKELTRELVTDPELKRVLFGELDAEELPNVCIKYSVNSVPTILFIRNRNVVERLVGADVRNYAERVLKHASDADGDQSVETVPVRTVVKTGSVNANSGPATSTLSPFLSEKLKQLINLSRVMIFMKGNPAQPRCGFSRQVIELMNESGVEYKTFDILEDDEVRQGLKEFSQWQTYPQIYINGSLVGGLDIIRDMQEMGTLMDALTGKEPI